VWIYDEQHYNVVILFVSDLHHVSNGLADVDSNQLITPKFKAAVGQILMLSFIIEPQQLHETFWLHVYKLNELHRRFPNRLYSKKVVSLHKIQRVREFNVD